LRRWMARPELDDAVLIRHLPETRELHVLLPACCGGDWFELVVWFAYVVVDGGIRVSTPDYQKASTVESRMYHDLIDAMNEGISTHERAPILDGAWGVLGSYLGVDKERTACDAATKRLHDPLIALGKQRARHRLYPGAVTFDERDRHLETVETKSPIAFETCLDAIYDNGIALVYRLQEP
jgi:hypothetical protein